MNSGDFETRLRSHEHYHSLRVLRGLWTVVRVDGRGFSRLTAERYQKPFDERFRDAMVAAARALLEEFHGIYVYTESDEISLLLPPEWDLFDREVEKTVSVTAGLASAVFTQESGHLAHFDSRLWLGTGEDLVVDYFRWRQADATRCALNGWCYWTLRQTGQSAGQATAALERAGVDAKNELLFQHGINFNDLPLWQRRGIGLWRETYEKLGHNPLTGETVPVSRRRVRVEMALPMGDEYSNLLLERLAAR